MKALRTFFVLLTGFFLMLLLNFCGNTIAAAEIKSGDPAWKVAILTEEGERHQSLGKAACLSLSHISGEMDITIDPLFIALGNSDTSCSREDLPLILKKQGVDAVLCLLRGPILFSMGGLLEKIDIPVIFVWSARSHNAGNPQNRKTLHFDLDFPRSFLPSAIAVWARSRNETNWSVFVDHLDRRSKEMGKLTSDAFFSYGMDCMTMELLRNSRYGFVNSSEECLSYGSTNILSWLVPSDTINLQRSLFELGACNMRLIYGGPAIDVFLGTPGISLFSQDPFPGKDCRDELKSSLPSNLMDNVSLSDLVKARAGLLWLFKGFESLSEGEDSPAVLASSLEKVTSLSLPGFSADLSPSLHRPLRKTVFLLRSSGGEWVKEDEMKLEVSDTVSSAIVQ